MYLCVCTTDGAVVCMLYSSLVLLPADSWGGMGASNWEDGLSVKVCPRKLICSNGFAQVSLLMIARISAYWMLPSMVLVFLSKCKALNTALENTIITLWVPLADLHQLHAKMGSTCGWCVLLHTLTHLVRWALSSESFQTWWDLVSTRCGTSGIIGAAVTVPICVLMGAPKWFRVKFKWETRKSVCTSKNFTHRQQYRLINT